MYVIDLGADISARWWPSVGSAVITGWGSRAAEPTGMGWLVCPCSLQLGRVPGALGRAEDTCQGDEGLADSWGGGCWLTLTLRVPGLLTLRSAISFQGTGCFSGVQYPGMLLCVCAVQ